MNIASQRIKEMKILKIINSNKLQQICELTWLRERSLEVCYHSSGDQLTPFLSETKHHTHLIGQKQINYYKSQKECLSDIYSINFMSLL